MTLTQKSPAGGGGKCLDADAGDDPEDAHCLRLVVEYPPLPSTIAMSIELATKPGP